MEHCSVLLCLFCLLAVFEVKTAVAQVEAPIQPVDEEWAWCVEDKSDVTKCEQMVNILQRLDPEKAHSHTCKMGGEHYGCMKMVSSGEARFVILDGAEIYDAAKEYNLTTIRVEVSDLEGFYYSVGVVNKGQCPGSLKELAGKRSCHTGYGRAAGWVLPVAKLIYERVMPVVTAGPGRTDIKSVKAFFSKSCAADDNMETSICTACKSGNNCSEADDYYDYAGAFRGLVEGACDIAFTKHTIPVNYALGQSGANPDWSNLKDAPNYSLVCPELYNGQQCTAITNWADCNFGRAPGHAIMVSSNWPREERVEFNLLMDRANNDTEFRALFFTGVNVNGSLFAPDAIRTDNDTDGPWILVGGSLLESLLTLKFINENLYQPSIASAELVLPNFSVGWLCAGVLYFLTL